MFNLVRKFLVWADKQIKENRPIRHSAKSLPGQVFEPITSTELRQLGEKIGIDPSYIERLIDDHEFSATAFEFGDHWFQIVGSHR